MKTLFGNRSLNIRYGMQRHIFCLISLSVLMILTGCNGTGVEKAGDDTFQDYVLAESVNEEISLLPVEGFRYQYPRKDFTDVLIENVSEYYIKFGNGYGVRIFSYVSESKKWEEIDNRVTFNSTDTSTLNDLWSPHEALHFSIGEVPLSPDLSGYDLPVELRIYVEGTIEGESTSRIVGAYIDITFWPDEPSGYTSNPVSPTSLIEPSLVLRLQDFPSGWKDDLHYLEDIPTALESFRLVFYPSSSSRWLYVIYQLTIYKDAETARNSIPYWEARLFLTDAWTYQEETIYETLQSEDYLRSWYLDRLVENEPVRDYEIIQVHGNRIVHLSVILDEEAVKQDFLLAVLERVDERIQGGAPIELDPIVVPTPLR